MEEPCEEVGASCVWKGPRTVPSVLEGGLGWSIESINSDKPSVSDNKMNSYKHRETTISPYHFPRCVCDS